MSNNQLNSGEQWLRDPLHNSDLTFPCEEANLIFNFAWQVRSGHYPTNLTMPERYLTFRRLYNVHNPEDRWLPAPPPFAQPEHQVSTMDRFNRIALANLERTQVSAGPYAVHQYLDDTAFEPINPRHSTVVVPRNHGPQQHNSGHRQRQRYNRRKQPPPYSGGREERNAASSSSSSMPPLQERLEPEPYVTRNLREFSVPLADSPAPEDNNNNNNPEGDLAHDPIPQPVEDDDQDKDADGEYEDEMDQYLQE